MTIQINGTSGISGVDGSAGTPAIQGTDTNTGISFGTDEVNINTGGITRATVDSSGRVGIGATPASWDPDSGLSAIQLNGYGAIWNYYNNVQLAFNAYQSATGDKYLTADNAAKYTLDSGGNHVWYTASSGSANGAITWSERARIDSSGNVGIGVTPSQALHIAGTTNRTPVAFKGSGTGTGYLYADNTSFGISTKPGSLDETTAFVGVDSDNHVLFVTSGTERARVTATGDFKFNSGYGSVATAYGCRAWVNFNGTGTVAIRGSGNVSSITDNGTGDYTVNFTTAMPDANYTTTLTTSSAQYILWYSGNGGADPTTAAVRVASRSSSAALVDAAIFNVAIFR